MAIDLHTHSTASDGSLTPTELILAAKEAGISTIALTDHDTAVGLPEALAAGKKNGVEVVPGCELSVTSPGGTLHILGLWLPVNPVELTKHLDELLEYRHNRNHIIVSKLNKEGIDVTYDEIKAIAGEGSVGRPHIATVLMQKGVVKSVQEAFDTFLANGGKAYAPKRVLTAKDAIKLLKAEGATVVLAHPFQKGMGPDNPDEELARLKGFGLDAVEAYYSSHTPQQEAEAKSLAKKHGLLVSGGSDFHGTPKPNIALGKGYGKLYVPDSVLDDLKALRKSQGLPVE